MKSQIIYLDIEEIKPYKKNPRINDKAIKAVANSIKKFGFNQPILVDQDNVICVGNTRFKAAKELCFKTIPCIKKTMSKEEFRAYNIIDNKTNELADWDFVLLIPELENLKEIYDLKDFDIDLDDLNKIAIKEKEIDENIETENKCPKCGYEW